MSEIGHIENIDALEVNKEEKLRKGEYKKRQREEHLQIEKIQDEIKNAELRARMDRVVQKVGKPTMPRSTKKRLTKEEVVVKVDMMKEIHTRYLGEDFAATVADQPTA